MTTEQIQLLKELLPELIESAAYIECHAAVCSPQRRKAISDARKLLKEVQDDKTTPQIRSR